MKLFELGEFGLINLIHGTIDKLKNPQQSAWQQLLLGIGDDAAAWQGDNLIQLATTDTLVQDIHFDLNFITWDELGWKALAVNLSDIAAMGGIPKYALLSLALPGEIEVESISRFTTSMAHLAAEYGVAIAGGNITGSPNIVITITVLGYLRGKTMLKRSTASPGEQVAITGYLGLSAAALEMFDKKICLDTETTTILRKGHVQPVPKVKEAQILVQHGVKTAIDISDGLIADLTHICEASKVSAEIQIDRVPVHPLVKAHFPDYQELALHGGEDYELLFTASKTVTGQVSQALDCPVTVIGNIKEESPPQRVNLVDNEGNVIPYNKRGWEHFKNGISNAKLT